MTSRFPMICDSCAHKMEDAFACDAYPDGITLDPLKAELHQVPRPDQDNEIVYAFDGQALAQRDFLAFRYALVGGEEVTAS